MWLHFSAFFGCIFSLFFGIFSGCGFPRKSSLAYQLIVVVVVDDDDVVDVAVSFGSRYFNKLHLIFRLLI